MKKALLITWINGQNYGTLLQAYCLKEILSNPNIFFQNNILEKLNVKILNYTDKKNNNNLHLKEKFNNALNRGFKENFCKLINKFEYKKIKDKLYIREKKFDKFRDENLDLYPKQIISNKSDLYNLNNFDIYIIGSDQIWNPKFLDDVYLLNWVPKNKQKMSYAPSVCVDTLSKTELYKYKVLNNFKSISVREYTHAVKEISKLINKKIEEVVDPVILFGRNALLKYCTKNIKNGYCLTYLLGKDSLTRKYSIKFAANNNLKIKSIIAVNTSHIVNDKFLYKYAIWNVDPLDLIDIIYNSSIVITDSFHIIVISVLLHKNFIILEREKNDSNQNNRLVNFLKNIGLENKLNIKPDNLNEANITEEEWIRIDKNIEKMRLQSFDFLIKTLK